MLNKSIVETFEVPILAEKMRLSDFPVESLTTIYSKKAFKKAIKKGLVHINNVQSYTSDYLFGKESITIYQDQHADKKPSIELDLDVLFEDEFLAVINKPAGIVVSGNKKFTIENALSGVLFKSKQPDRLSYPLLTHRLDYPTSGCMIVAKTSSCLVKIHELFRNRMIDKKYHAITTGDMKEKGVVDHLIGNKESISKYKLLKSLRSDKYSGLNLVELKPLSGRKHQLRIHMAHIGNPILGDRLYGHTLNKGFGNGLYLQASALTFKHPLDDKIVSVQLDLPTKFKQFFQESIY